MMVEVVDPFQQTSVGPDLSELQRATGQDF